MIAFPYSNIRYFSIYFFVSEVSPRRWCFALHLCEVESNTAHSCLDHLRWSTLLMLYPLQPMLKRLLKIIAIWLSVGMFNTKYPNLQCILPGAKHCPWMQFIANVTQFEILGKLAELPNIYFLFVSDISYVKRVVNICELGLFYRKALFTDQWQTSVMLVQRWIGNSTRHFQRNFCIAAAPHRTIKTSSTKSSQLQYLARPGGNQIAYRKTNGYKCPGVVFLPGFMSNMNGGKALALETYCEQHGHSFVR